MKEDLSLVIMAAGIGSRYGGLKQIDSIDNYGNLIIDFSIYDALMAGFKRIVFIITKEIEQEFKAVIGNRISKYADVEYVFQETSHLPNGYTPPETREKPWGTGHAIFCCKDAVKGSFATINADDYYGRNAFEIMYAQLKAATDNHKYQYKMVGYELEKTLTDSGSVARGICTVNEHHELTAIQERTDIRKHDGRVLYYGNSGDVGVELAKDAIVSMNLWGFTNSIFSELAIYFENFLTNEAKKDFKKSEFFLPSVVNDLIKKDKAAVEVLKSSDKWYGVTYKSDKEAVVEAMKNFKMQGLYPEKLWEGK